MEWNPRLAAGVVAVGATVVGVYFLVSRKSPPKKKINIPEPTRPPKESPEETNQTTGGTANPDTVPPAGAKFEPPKPVVVTEDPLKKKCAKVSYYYMNRKTCEDGGYPEPKAKQTPEWQHPCGRDEYAREHAQECYDFFQAARSKTGEPVDPGYTGGGGKVGIRGDRVGIW